MRRGLRLLFTCEHGGNQIPAEYAVLFSSERARGLLQSHRGWDAGALSLARKLSAQLRSPLFYSQVSRLLVDLNRSEHHPRIFSEFTRSLSLAERNQILNHLYRPHRAAVEEAVSRIIARGPGGVEHACLHIAVHSFTPELDGIPRRTDIGLLYDPARRLERSIGERWKSALLEICPDLHISRNAPYRGVADGLTSTLRKRFPSKAYAGFELEINQRLLTGTGGFRKDILKAFPESIGVILSGR